MKVRRMNRYLIFVVPMLLIHLAIPGQAHARTASYDQVIMHGGQSMRSSVVIKDERTFRMESTVQGMKTIIVSNQSGVFSYMPTENLAIKLPSLEQIQKPMAGADDYTEHLKQLNAEFLGKETVNGYNTDIYRYYDEAAKAPVTVWVWTEEQFPVRLQMRAATGAVQSDITNIRFNVPVSDSMFQLPAGAQIMDMSTLMGGAGGFPMMMGSPTVGSGLGGGSGNSAMPDMQKLLEGLMGGSQ